MKKYFLTIAGSVLLAHFCISQTTSGQLSFQQGQVFEINLQSKTTVAQEAMGRKINFDVEAGALHSYTVTNATDENITLHHTLEKVNFLADGMGLHQKFNSDNEKDMKGLFGPVVKDMLDKKYDMIINPNGEVKMAFPKEVKLNETDSRLSIVTSMLKEITALVQPPQAGEGSFFKILPDTISTIGSQWSTTIDENGGSKTSNYTLTSFTDSTIVIDFTANANTVSKAEMMGNETTTRLQHTITGKIILDRNTNILKEQTSTTESTGTTKSSFGDIPISSKTTTTITVQSSHQKS